MQIPGNPFPTGPGFLHQPQPGTRQQATPDLQAKANAPGARPAAARPDPRAAKATPQAAQARPPAQEASRGAAPTSSLAGARTLEQAVQTLADEGRLPPRGSLVDLRA